MKDASTTRVATLREALLELHKAMLDAQRVRFERVNGRIATRGEFLGYVLGHPEFEWMRTLSGLMARLDEWAEKPAGEGDVELDGLVSAVRALIEPRGGDALFGSRYWQLVEEEPAVTMAHVKVWRLVER